MLDCANPDVSYGDTLFFSKMLAPKVNNCANPDVSDECVFLFWRKVFREQDIARRYRYDDSRRALL